MKTFLLVILFCISQIACAQHKLHDLKETINEFNTAFKEGDVDKLSAMISKNYLHTNSTSAPINKETWIAYLNKRKKEIESKKLVIHTYEMKETRVQQYDDMAIVSAKIITSSTKNGKLNNNEYRVTNIWVLEDGAWKRAGFHDGKIK